MKTTPPVFKPRLLAPLCSRRVTLGDGGRYWIPVLRAARVRLWSGRAEVILAAGELAAAIGQDGVLRIPPRRAHVACANALAANYRGVDLVACYRRNLFTPSAVARIASELLGIEVRYVE